MSKILPIAALILLLLVGCGGTSEMYPLNAEANAIGSIRFTCNGFGGCEGAAAIKGGYAEVVSSGHTFGTGQWVNGKYLVPQTWSTTVGPNGVAPYTGDRGNSIDCEYTTAGGMVMGTCTRSNGGLFRLH